MTHLICPGQRQRVSFTAVKNQEKRAGQMPQEFNESGDDDMPAPILDSKLSGHISTLLCYRPSFFGGAVTGFLPHPAVPANCVGAVVQFNRPTTRAGHRLKSRPSIWYPYWPEEKGINPPHLYLWRGTFGILCQEKACESSRGRLTWAVNIINLMECGL
jgi:hypothetical protein